MVYILFMSKTTTAAKTTVKAMSITDRTPFTDRDVRDLNRTAKLLFKYGAISAERLAHLTKQSTFSAAWCLNHIGAVITDPGLYMWAVV